MGSSRIRRWRLGAGYAAPFVLATGLANAQIPGGAPTRSEPEPTSPAVQPAPTPTPAPPPAAAASPPAPPASAPPPLDPPPEREPARRPTFLKTREELERARPDLKLPPPPLEARPAIVSRPLRGKTEVPKDFVVKATPWVDLALTSFWMSERSSNFLNLSVQVGGYFAERLRLSARVTAPLEEAEDEYDNYDSGFSPFGNHPDSRSISLLYGASAGLILSNSKTFLFAPSITVWRTDVNDYGTTGGIALPFEWTTHRHLRVGFELALGHSFGGEVDTVCGPPTNNAEPCRSGPITRPGGTAVLLQYSMGWSLALL